MSDLGPILVTGSSGGIGKAVCERFVRSGHVVYASARRKESLADLGVLGCETLALDVNDESSIRAAVSHIEERHGAIGALINNAGFGVYGPIEQVALDEVRTQFETNVFGLVRLTQLVLPAMRARGRGRIVNVSSVAGRLTFPGGAFYQASKFTLEALSDSLRLEVAPFGIKVVIVEPGPVKTDWARRAASSIPLEDAAATDTDPYGDFKVAVTAMLLGRQSGVGKYVESSPAGVARVIARAVMSAHPRTRYAVGLWAKVTLATKGVLPDRAYDAVLRRIFRVP